MKRMMAGLLMAAMLAACSTAAVPEATQLLITGDQPDQSYTVEQLKSLAAASATFNGDEFTGVLLRVLLEQAGYDLGAVNAVQAKATDGYSVTYDGNLALHDDTLVAYGRGEGALVEDDGSFRMVLPDQEGKMNLRFLAELHVNP